MTIKKQKLHNLDELWIRLNYELPLITLYFCNRIKNKRND